MTGQDRTIQWMTGQYLNLSILYERRHLVGAIFSRLRDPSATMVSELPGSVKSGFPGKQRGPGSVQPAAGARHRTRITKQVQGGSVGACSAKNVEIKDCMFMCGCTLGRTKSPLESGQLIEAEYPGGLGTADLFCANTYRAKYRHKYTREELVAEMKANKEIMDKFLQHRAAAIARAKRKLEKGTFKSCSNAHSSTSAARSLSRNNQYEEALLPPAPDVLPWDEYTETVSSTLQKNASDTTR